MKPADSADVKLDALIGLFFRDEAALGHFAEVSPDQIPEPQRGLLAHDHHMTVSVEGHHLSPVNVVVLEAHTTDQTYSRKILLTRQSDGVVVQYGIVRLDLSVLDNVVADEIVSEKTPLGRILISHNVLRRVKLHNLYQIQPSLELKKAFDLADSEIVFGRTALIYCNGSPAVELLEIVGNC